MRILIVTALTVATLMAATLVAATVAAGPAGAQTERLPSTSRSERQVNDINGSLARQQRVMRDTQQNQFEVNQLRSQLSRDAISTLPPISVPSAGRICAPGSVAC